MLESQLFVNFLFVDHVSNTAETFLRQLELGKKNQFVLNLYIFLFTFLENSHVVFPMQLQDFSHTKFTKIVSLRSFSKKLKR